MDGNLHDPIAVPQARRIAANIAKLAGAHAQIKFGVRYTAKPPGKVMEKAGGLALPA
jgi:hypothetical protein